MSTQPIGLEPGLGGLNRPPALSGAEPQLGGSRRLDLRILDFLSRGLWTSIGELEQVTRHIPSDLRSRYRDALIARLELVNPADLLPEVKPWRGGRDQRVRIIDSLGLLGDASIVPVLEPLIDDPNAEVRRSALTALGRLGIREAVHPLARILESETASSHDQVIAAEALALIAHPDAVPYLIAALNTSRDDLVNRKIIQALSRIDDDTAIACLIDVLQNAVSPVLRGEAAHALGRLGHIKGMAYLCEALTDPDARVRLMCVEALRNFNWEIARGGLHYALSDADEQVAEAAAMALDHRRQPDR
jgi:HEAT repeat protein